MKNILIDVKDVNDLRKKLRIVGNDTQIFVLAKDETFNRKVMEIKEINGIVGFESGFKKDKLKQRDSGLNQVLCKIARDNDIKIGIDFEFLNIKNDFEIAKILSRIEQNVRLCKKYKTKMIAINFSGDEYGLMAFFLSVGLPTDMAKYAAVNRIVSLQ